MRGFLRISLTGLGIALFALSIIGTPLTRADSSPSLSGISRRLHDHRALAQHHALVFEGEITRLQEIPRPTCSGGVEHRVTYRILQILWSEPDSPETPGYTVNKGFIDCTEKPLPSPPFVVGARVFVYCETRRSFTCLPPVEGTSKNGKKVRSWLDEIQAAEGGPAMLQIHERLLQSEALLRKTPPATPPLLNGENSSRFVFIGQIVRVQKLSDFPTLRIVPRLEMDVKVSRVLWGDYKDTVLAAWCNSSRCGGAMAGETVIMHCYATHPRAECSAPVPYSDDAFKKMETWVGELGRN